MVSIVTYGAVMNDNSSGARSGNKTALINAQASNYDIEIPEGNLYLPATAAIEWQPGRRIRGAGMYGGTNVYGDGNIFKVTTAIEGRIMQDFQIANENTTGNVILFLLNAPLGRVEFRNMYFKKAARHIHSEGQFIVDWLFDNCRFQESTGAWSRYFDGGVMNLTDQNVICGGNNGGVYIVGGGNSGGGGYSYNCVFRGGEYSGNASNAFQFVTGGGDINSIIFDNIYMEGNGANTSPAVYLYANSANVIRSVNFIGGTMTAPNANMTKWVDWTEASGGTIGKVRSSAFVESGQIFAPNSNKVYNDGMVLKGNSAQASWKTATYA